MPTVVFLDDDQALLDIYQRAAQIALPEWKVETFSSPEDFKKFVADKNSFDILMTDFNMPPSNMNGTDVAAMVREFTARQETKPVIILCSSDIQNNKNERLFDLYLPKPARFLEISGALGMAKDLVQSRQKLFTEKSSLKNGAEFSGN